MHSHNNVMSFVSSSDARGEQQQIQSSAYGYIPYDPPGTMYSAPQAPLPMYSQNVMYFPMTASTGTITPSETSPDVVTLPSDSRQSKSLDQDAAAQGAPEDAQRRT